MLQKKAYFPDMLLTYIFGPSVVKYDILSNYRRSKLHAVSSLRAWMSPYIEEHKGLSQINGYEKELF